MTRNEIATYTEQIEMAAEQRQLVLIHTPHLEDKHKGTRISVDVLRRHPELKPSRVLVDHAEEHTIEAILEHGYWAGLTLYPQTKISPQRAVDVIEQYGPDRILVAGACDWGPSDPIAVPRFAMEMRRRRHPEAFIHRVIFENPVTFLSQSPKFVLPAGVADAVRRGSATDRQPADRQRTWSRRQPQQPAMITVQLDRDAGLHLTYCTNIHPGNGWAAVDANIRRYAPALKAGSRPREPFGLGLRLSARRRASCSPAKPRRAARLPRRTPGCTSR